MPTVCLSPPTFLLATISCLLPLAACSGGGGGAGETAPPSTAQQVTGSWQLTATTLAASGPCGNEVGDVEILNAVFAFSDATTGAMEITTDQGSPLTFAVSVSGNQLNLSGTDTSTGETASLLPGSQLVFSSTPPTLSGLFLVETTDGVDTCTFDLDIGGTPGSGGGGGGGGGDPLVWGQGQWDSSTWNP